MEKTTKQLIEDTGKILREIDSQLLETINQALKDDHAILLMILLADRLAEVQSRVVRGCDGKVAKKQTASVTTVTILSTLQRVSGLAEPYEDLIDNDHLNDLKKIYNVI